MTVPSNMPKWYCRTCHNKIPIPDLEAVFAQQFKGFVFSPEAIAEHLEEVDTTIRAKRELLATLLREEESVRDEAEKLYRLYLEGGLSVVGFRERNDPLGRRKEELAREIPRLRGEIDFLRIRDLHSSEVLAEARSLYERWDTLPFEAKRAIVETVVGKITVGAGEVEIELAAVSYASSPEPHPQTLLSPELVAQRERIPKGSWQRAARTGQGRRDGRGCAPS